jgi:anaerobic magnesium-protoporphyrin IX monomethyl ester cyclase
MSKVALVFPYFRTKVPTEMLFSPLGMASLAAQLRLLSIETGIFDCTFKTIDQINEEILAFCPDIIGIYSMITLSRNTFRLAEFVRTHLPECLLVAGGPLPTLYPKRYCERFDAVFRGEADLSFPRFCQVYFAQKITRSSLQRMPLQEFAGLFIDNLTEKINNPCIHHTEAEIETFPLPDRSDFDHQAYQREWLQKTGSKTASIMTTLGCPFDCDFCSKPVFGNLYRRRNLDSVFAEIESILQLGYDSLWIADDNFTLNLSYLESFCRRMADRQINWACLSRTTGIDQEIAALMKRGCCKRVYLGLESGSQATLKLMNKKATLEDGYNAVHHFKKVGIEVAAFFIVGYPGESEADIEETFKYAMKLPLDEISFNVPFPLPGSRLFERATQIDEEKDWDKENEVTFVFQTEFDQTWLKRRIDQTMQIFEKKINLSEGSNPRVQISPDSAILGS